MLMELSELSSLRPRNELTSTTSSWLLLADYTDVYGKRKEENTPGGILRGIIRRANEKTGQKVVVLIDEYDAPLLGVMHETTKLKAMRKVMQEFYIPLKANEQYVKFCFITGITKFSQLSIFSTINNITNVTMDTMFSAICGITEEELSTVMKEDIERLAGIQGLSYEQMHHKLKERYDGYHFTKNSPEIYNPFSLLKAFQQREVANYWFESGTPTFLIHQMQHFKTDIMSLDRMEVPASAFDQPTENMKSALPLLYQSGYLTIKDYDRDLEAYTLSIPNQEVRIGYVKGLLPIYTGLNDANVQMGFAAKFWKALKQGDIELAMQEMKAYLAGIPYVEGFKKKLEEVSAAEGFYEYTMYLIFSMLNVYARTQVKVAGGRIDMVVWMPDTTYVFELREQREQKYACMNSAESRPKSSEAQLKVNGTAEEALQQINDKGDAFPYKTEGRKVVKVGVKFNADTRVPEEWMVKEDN